MMTQLNVENGKKSFVRYSFRNIKPAKFGFCHCKDMVFLSFRNFVLKCLFAPKIFSFFSYDPQTWYVIVETRNPKGHVRG